MTKSISFFFVLSAFAGAVVFAADQAPASAEPKPADVETIFKKRDKNGDGVLSFEEFKVSRLGRTDPAKAEEVFRKRDKDGNGSLTLEEMKADLEGTKPAAPDKKVGTEGEKARDARKIERSERREAGL